MTRDPLADIAALLVSADDDFFAHCPSRLV